MRFPYATPYNVDLADLNSQEADRYIKSAMRLNAPARKILFGAKTAVFIVDHLAPKFGLSPAQTEHVARAIRDTLLQKASAAGMPALLAGYDWRLAPNARAISVTIARAFFERRPKKCFIPRQEMNRHNTINLRAGRL